jgi:hypothetical protein
MKVLLLYVLLCLSGCASTIQIGQSRHDIGFQLLKENEGQNSTVVELRQLGVGFSLGSSQTGVMLGYKRDTSFGDVTRYPDVRPTLVMGNTHRVITKTKTAIKAASVFSGSNVLINLFL